MLSVKFPINSRLSVFKFQGSQKFSVDFQLCRGSESLGCSSINHMPYVLCWQTSIRATVQKRNKNKL